MKLSIIIPVYHTQDTLPRCLDSILRQSFTDYEVILVDDGSTDDSPKICDAYSRQDGRVKVIHKENGGLSDARNAGILQAKGEYITFIDSDDTIAEDTLSLVIEKIITYPETDILEYPVMERVPKNIYCLLKKKNIKMPLTIGWKRKHTTTLMPGIKYINVLYLNIYAFLKEKISRMS